MSGDVQPRKRKDKKKKKDEDDIKETSQPSTHHHPHHHASTTLNDDIQLHIQKDHGTGGHWCAKIVFFALMAILFGLIGLIILENRGLTDLETPVTESRFSEYFDGWVEETQHEDHHETSDHNSHTDHDDHDDDHDDPNTIAGDDHSEEDHDDERSKELDTEDHSDEEDEGISNMVDSKKSNEKNELDDKKSDENDSNSEEENDKSEETDIEEKHVRVKRGLLAREISDEQDDDDDIDNNKNDDDDEDEGFDDQMNDDTSDDDDHEKKKKENSKDSEQNDSDNAPFEELEDDGSFEDERVIENDSGEDLLLEKLSKKDKTLDETEETIEENSSLGVKIFVGLALVIVAHLVLVKKSSTQAENDEKILAEEISMKRRLTIVTDDEQIHFDNQDEIDDFDDEDYGDDGEEEGEEEEEEEEYSDEEIEEKSIQNVAPKLSPATFERLNAMYKVKSDIKTTDDVVPAKVAPKPIYQPLLLDDRDKITTTKDEPKAFAKIDTKMEINRPKNIAQQSKNVEPFKIEPVKPTESLDSTEKKVLIPVKPVEPIIKNIVPPTQKQEELEHDDVEEEEEDEEYSEEDEDMDDEEEDLSDVDDTDLMKRLEAKYGKLPATEKDEAEDEDTTWTKLPSRGGGPQNVDDNILRNANKILSDNPKSALKLFESILKNDPLSTEALFGKAQTLDRLAAEQQSNFLLDESIKLYTILIRMGNKVDNEIFKAAGERCIDRLRFKGQHLKAVEIHEDLIKRFVDKPEYRNQLAITYLLVNRLSEAKKILHETLLRWRTNGVALVHYGFVLKVLDKNMEKSAQYLKEGIDTDEEGTNDGRFYFSLGEALTRLGRTSEAHDIYKLGAKKKLFLSQYQRSLYNVDRLKSQPFWTKKNTTYTKYFNILEQNWEKIRDEGLNVLSQDGYFKNETEDLRDIGQWKQFDLFAQGQKRIKNCEKTPFTCKIIEMFPAARFCKRGQVKFSVMHPGTHVWPHCGPTNCRIRAHLGLKVPTGTLIRVADETRTWENGKILIFDDSFEHEVWHNGTIPRLILIIDVWHPDLTEQEWQMDPI